MTNIRRRKKLGEHSSFLAKSLIGILFITPLIVGLLFSFQPENELGSIPLHLLTKNPTIENYIGVFDKVPLLSYLKNTLVVCICAISAQIVFSSMAAYAFAYFEFPLKKQLFTIILMSMMIPGEVVIITNYVTIQKLGLINTYVGLFITSMISGTAIFMMRQYYLTLPKDFKEAATLDGCGDIGFLFRIATPLSVPTITALAIYLFVHIYNQFFWPLLVTNSNSMRTVQIGISFLVTGDALAYGEVLAGATVAIIPSVLAYVFGQDYIIKGMTRGGIKG